jgi:hypothetical protein
MLRFDRKHFGSIMGSQIGKRKLLILKKVGFVEKPAETFGLASAS